MADPKIKFKRSAVAGKIPTAAQVPLGEIALNTNDGILYASKDVGAGTTVIAVNPFRVGTGTDSYNAFFTAGNVGIGSTQPTGKLDVQGQVNIKSTSTTTTSGTPISYTGSVLFDGVNDYLTVGSHADLAMGTGDFTIEMWVYSTDSSLDTQDRRFFASEANGTSAIQFGHINTTGGIVEYATNGSLGIRVTGTTDIRNRWAHVAVVRKNNTVTLYIDGKSEGTPATDSNSKSASNPTIGKYPGLSGHFKGNMSNVRVVKGKALYTSNFTPQTAELTEVYNTTLLACQSSSSATAEATGKTVTAYGAAASTTNPSLVKGFDTSGSVYIDNSTGVVVLNAKHLSIADHADLQLNNSDFTLEAWIYPENNSSQSTIVSKWGPNSSDHEFRFTIETNESLKLELKDDIGAFVTTRTLTTSANTVTLDKWHHVAITRSGSNLRLYVDGVEKASTSTVSGSVPNTSSALIIGAQIVAANPYYGSAYNGYISNFRIIRGSALYTSAFTPSYVELQNLPNTKFLACQSSSSATAYTVSPGTISANNGAAASSTSPGTISSHSLTGSVDFNGGDDDYLTVASGADFAFGTGDFTVECFVYQNTQGSYDYLIDGRNGSQTTGTWSLAHGYGSGTTLQFGTSSSALLTCPSGSQPGTNKWYHVAVSRSGTSLKMFIDGVQVDSATNSTNFSTSPTISYIGTRYSTEHSLDGHISNLRVIKGTALYTSTFTPPREELTNVTNTKLLCCQSSSSATAAAVAPGTITSYGNAAASTTSPGLVKSYTSATGLTTTTTTTPGNLLVSGITTATNRIDIKSNDSTPGRIDFYCESSNAHYTQLRSAAHASYSGIATVTLPTSTGTLLLTDGSGANLTNLPAANLTGTLPAISGANLTNLNGSNISSGTVAAARVGALPASKVTSGTFDAARIPTLNQNTTGTAAGLTGSPNITVSDVNVGGGLSVTGNSFFVGVVTFAAGTDGNIVLGDTATDNVVFNADVNSNIVPNTNNAYDLGSSSQKWRNLFISGNANIGGTLTYEDVTNIDSVGIITARKNIELPDSTGATVGRILFGAGDDLQIYHDGSHSYIDDAGTGNLRLRSGTLEILNLAGSKKSAVFNSGSGQELYFDNSKKFETVTGGVTITGTATATLFSGSGASLTNLPAANLTGTLPAISGANLTNLDASDLASGTIPDARFPAALPAIDGSALTGITASGTGAIGGLTIKNQSGAVVGTAGSVSTIDFDGSAGVTVTATTGAAGIATVLISADLVTDTSPQLGGNLDLNGNNITGSGNIPAANLTGTLPAISGANLTNLNGSNISSGTVSAARVGALPASKITTGTFADARIPDLAASKITSGTFDAARIPTLNQDTTGTSALAEGLTGSPTIGVSTITTTGSVGIGSTQPTGKLDVLGQVNIKASTITSGLATSYTGSVYLDGNSDYLTVPGPGTLAASSNWTLECYFYCTGTSSGTYRIVSANESVNGSQYSLIRIRNGQYQFFTDNAYSSLVGTATFNEWHHIAFTKTGTTLRGFVDGVKILQTADNNSDTITTLVVGWGYGSEYFPGYISNVRFVNGTSLYKSNFTPQTAELTKIYNTTHLLAQSSSSATAEATGKTVTAVGTAAASTTNPSLEKGFDLSGSVDFDGNGDYLSINGSSDFNFGTGDFTIECFIKPDSLNTSAYTSQLSTIFDYDQNAGTTGAWFAMHQGNAGFNWGSNNNTQISATSGLTLGWNHIAVVRSGSTTTVYINGKSGGSATDNHNYTDSSTRELWIGKQQAGVNRQFNGYISNFRIVKGTAIYTAEFSPTFTELTNLPNTKLLALQSASSATAYTVSPGTITAYGDATASSTSPGLISPNSLTGSVQFDGSDDKLTTADSADYVLLQDFTFEAWAYRTSDPNPYSRIAHWGDYWGNNTAVALTFDDGNNQDKVRFVSYSGIAINSTSDVESNKWYHIAITRSGNTYRMFINGVLEGSTTSSTTIHSGSTTELCIGSTHNRDVEEPFAGHISNVRFVKGTALYTSAFTPPREALTNVTNTKLLCCQSSSSVTEAAVGSVTASSAPVASTTSPGLVKVYSTGTPTTTTTPGNLLVSGITTATNRIDIKSDDSTPGRIDFYCESSNAHYTQLRSAAHSAYSGIATVTLPTSSGTLLLSDGDGSSLTGLSFNLVDDTTPQLGGYLDLNSKGISGAGIITATSFSGNLTGGILDSNGTTRISATTSLITLNDDTRVNGHLRVQGNQIRNSAGNANIIFSGNNTSINGDLNMGVGGASITQNNGLDVLTFTSGSNELTAEGKFNVEGLSNLKLGAVVTGVCTATSFVGDGSNLTNLPSATIAGISTAGTSTFNHVSVTGVATVSTAFYLPQYTTTARDAGTFNEGAMIYNTTTKKMEFYDGTNWNTLPGVTLGLGMGVF